MMMVMMMKMTMMMMMMMMMMTMSSRRNENLQRKSKYLKETCPRCPPQFPQNLTWDRTRAAVAY
jgi:hypothetical protein